MTLSRVGFVIFGPWFYMVVVLNFFPLTPKCWVRGDASTSLQQVVLHRNYTPMTCTQGCFPVRSLPQCAIHCCGNDKCGGFLLTLAASTCHFEGCMTCCLCNRGQNIDTSIEDRDPALIYGEVTPDPDTEVIVMEDVTSPFQVNIGRMRPGTVVRLSTTWGQITPSVMVLMLKSSVHYDADFVHYAINIESNQIQTRCRSAGSSNFSVCNTYTSHFNLFQPYEGNIFILSLQALSDTYDLYLNSAGFGYELSHYDTTPPMHQVTHLYLGLIPYQGTQVDRIVIQYPS